jgi:hypothetical protein
MTEAGGVYPRMPVFDGWGAATRSAHSQCASCCRSRANTRECVPHPLASPAQIDVVAIAAYAAQGVSPVCRRACLATLEDDTLALSRRTALVSVGTEWRPGGQTVGEHLASRKVGSEKGLDPDSLGRDVVPWW